MLGVDYLGLGHKLFPIEAVRDLTPKGYAIGCFDTTFGDVLPNLRVLLDSGKFPAYRVHIGWTDNHTIGLPGPLRRRAALYQALSLEFPQVKFYLSFHCEAKENDKAQVQKRIQILRKVSPRCFPVNSNISHVVIRGVVNEFHDDKHGYEKPYIASMDGCGLSASGAWTIYGPDWKRLHNRADILFWWIPEFNLRHGAAPAPAPLKRRKPPTIDQIEQVISYTKL